MTNHNEIYKTRREIYDILLLFLILIIGGTIVYHRIENWNYITSFYFAVTTLTTVGYGDIYPTTEISRLFTACYILVGVSIFFYGLFSIGEYFVKKRMIMLERRVRAKNKIIKK